MRLVLHGRGDRANSCENFSTRCRRGGAYDNSDQCERCNKSSGLPSAWTRVTKLGIENREHSSLEFFASRHRQSNRRSSIVSNRRHDIEKMLGVIAGPRAAREREIIACTLALRAELLRRCPHQRMEPVNRACEAAECVACKIVTSHVRELVQQNGKATICSPVVAFRRQNNRRMKNSAGERHLRVFAS